MSVSILSVAVLRKQYWVAVLGASIILVGAEHFVLYSKWVFASCLLLRSIVQSAGSFGEPVAAQHQRLLDP